MDICKVKAERLMPAGYNPRIDLQPDDEEYKSLQKSMDAFGYIEPIIWNEQTGHVVGGHQRLKILLAKGYSEIEVSRINVSEEKEKLINVALNKVSGQWDEDKLEDILRDIQDSGNDVLLSGFSQDELDDILKDFENTDFMDFFAERSEESPPSSKQPDKRMQEEPPCKAKVDTMPEKIRQVQCPKCGEWVEV